MNRKQKIIVSIVGIAIVLLSLLGITYAYYLTRIQGNTNTNSISVTTADLKLVYGDGNNDLNFTNIMPGWINDRLNGNPEPKIFTVANNGNSSVNEYAVSLEEVMNTLSRTEDLTYTLNCTQKNSAGVVTGTCNGTTGEYPKTNTMLITNSIESGYIHEYELIVQYLNHETINQSIDMGSTIKGKVQIYGLTDTVDLTGTVSNYTEGDYIQINSETKTSRIVNNEYNLIGIKPGTHTIKVCSKTDTLCEIPTYEKKIVINKGVEAGVGETTIDGETYPLITITNESNTATIDIDVTSTTLNVNTTISSYNPFENNTLAYNIYQNKALVEEYDDSGTSLGTKRNKEIKSLPVVTGVSDGTNIEDSGLFIAADDYGTSYFYRGTVRNNYVDFAGFTWRIVRINGDRSVRLILDGSLDLTKDPNDNTKYVYQNFRLYSLSESTGEVPFNSDSRDNTLVGYMYGNENSSDYSSVHKNLNDSRIKKYIDIFYEEYLTSSYLNDDSTVVNENNKDSVGIGLENYLSDSLFCADKTRASNFINLSFDNANVIYYAGYKRLISSDTIIPTLKCVSINEIYDKDLTDEQLSYSRFTVNQTSIVNGPISLKVNSDLKYPIALISADELVLSGAYDDIVNANNYISEAYYNSNKTLSNRFWTMTPYSYNPNNNYSRVFTAKNSYSSLYHFSVSYNSVAVRPVINLKSDVLVDSGDGTKANPYIVKLSND